MSRTSLVNSAGNCFKESTWWKKSVKKQKFKINADKIKFLYSHGLIRKDEEGYVEFWVPLYKKAVYDAFYPYANGETKEQIQEINLAGFFMNRGKLDFDKLMAGYRAYVRRRGFRYFREKDEKGNWKQIKEAAVVYSFESFIQALLQLVNGKSYLEPHAGQGNCDLIININGKETVIEFKIYRDQARLEEGKKQVAYYSKSLSIDECIYLVFVPAVYKKLGMKDEVLEIDGTEGYACEFLKAFYHQHLSTREAFIHKNRSTQVKKRKKC